MRVIAPLCADHLSLATDDALAVKQLNCGFARGMWRGFLLGDHGRGKGDETCGEKSDVLHGRAIRSNENEMSDR